MQITAIKTSIVQPGDSLNELLVQSIPVLHERSIVVVTSKIVSLCENRVVDAATTKKADLVQQESDWFLSGARSQITVTNNVLIRSAGIDFTDNGTQYILWPTDAQQSANTIRQFLCDQYKLKEIGVLITDGASRPLRRGTTGIALAHSGFLALEKYPYQGVVKQDGSRPKGYSNADRAYGLAAAAVTVMGEGDEHTPLAVIEDVPFIQFQDRNPTPEELAELHTDFDTDFFSPLLNSIKWQKSE